MIALTECRTAEEVRALAKLVSQRRKQAFALPLPPQEPTPVPDTAQVVAIEATEESTPLPVEDFMPCWPIAPTEPVTMKRIIHVVAAYFGISINEIMSNRRIAAIVHARHVGYYLCSTITKRSYPEIGRAFGRDHTSVMHGAKKVLRRLESDPALVIQIEELKRAIG